MKSKRKAKDLENHEMIEIVPAKPSSKHTSKKNNSAKLSVSEQINKDELYLDNIDILECIGKGAFGQVYRGLWVGTTEVAMKTISNENISEFESEVNIWRKLNHPNVVRFLGIYKDSTDKLYMVMEYLSLGSLSDFLKKGFSKLQPNDLLVMILNTSAGMSYLEAKSVIHRDLGARNLLVTKSEEKYVVKIADLGLSRISNNENEYVSTANKFPVKWSPPEVIRYRQFSTKSDVWSFGVTCWEIFEAGTVPYQ